MCEVEVLAQLKLSCAFASYDHVNILSPENGHWLIGDEYQNVGGLKSVRTDLDDVPPEGWLYNDGTKWNNNDTTITVTGEGGEQEDILESQYFS